MTSSEQARLVSPTLKLLMSRYSNNMMMFTDPSVYSRIRFAVSKLVTFRDLLFMLFSQCIDATLHFLQVGN